MQNDDTNNTDIDEVEARHDATEDELQPLEPAMGAAENEGPSEEELPDAPDGVEENMFPSAPAIGQDGGDL